MTRARGIGLLVLGLAAARLLAADAPRTGLVPIAVFDFRLEDMSPAAVLLDQHPGHAATMEQVNAAARAELAQSGRYRVIDASDSAIGPAAAQSLRDCTDCDAGIALTLGAEQSLVGVVRRVTQTDYYVAIRIRDARSGRILDEEDANFAGGEEGWPSGVRMLIRHQVLPPTN